MLPRWYHPPAWAPSRRGDTLASVANLYGVSVAEIKGSSRLAPIVAARWEAMRRLREQGFSFSSIGRLVNRNHATVMHALRSIACP